MKAIVVLALFALLLASGPVASAQNDEAADLLVDLAALGEGWDLVAEVPPNDDLDPSFRDGAFAVYGGPDGARVVLAVYRVAEGMTAIRQSWEIANSVFDSYRNEIDYGFQISRENDLADSPLPEGCADARRIYGVDNIGFGEFPVGLTLCAADPDLIVLAYASGEVDGLTETEASDAVVEAVIAGGDGTPEADE